MCGRCLKEGESMNFDFAMVIKRKKKKKTTNLINEINNQDNNVNTIHILQNTNIGNEVIENLVDIHDASVFSCITTEITSSNASLDNITTDLNSTFFDSSLDNNNNHKYYRSSFLDFINQLCVTNDLKIIEYNNSDKDCNYHIYNNYHNRPQETNILIVYINLLDDNIHNNRLLELLNILNQNDKFKLCLVTFESYLSYNENELFGLINNLNSNIILEDNKYEDRFMNYLLSLLSYKDKFNFLILNSNNFKNDLKLVIPYDLIDNNNIVIKDQDINESVYYNIHSNNIFKVIISNIWNQLISIKTKVFVIM